MSIMYLATGTRVCYLKWRKRKKEKKLATLKYVDIISLSDSVASV